MDRVLNFTKRIKFSKKVIHVKIFKILTNKISKLEKAKYTKVGKISEKKDVNFYSEPGSVIENDVLHLG